MTQYLDHYLPLGFGFVSSIQDYKLVTICLFEDGIEFSICTSRVIDEWYPYKLRRCFDGVLLNGGPHWFIQLEIDEEEEEKKKKYLES